MPVHNAVVANVIRFEPPLDRPPADLIRAERGLAVELEGGLRIRFDPADARSSGFVQILEALRQQRRPIYVEVEPETSTIKRLLIPRVTRVLGIRSIDRGVFGIELERSHARHVLRSSSPDFEELDGLLRKALQTGELVIVTEDDAHEIIDIRAYTPGPEGPPVPFPKPELPPRLRWPWRWIKDLLDFLRRCPWWLCLWFRCTTADKAQQVLDALNASSCDPLTVPPPCIPFLYPDDGCWGRAHEMCRLMINMGLKPRKVWIQGYLHVSTKNHPDCEVWWGWHVAPTLCVRGPGFFQTKEMVIDPALFTTPVSQATWKGVQGDPNATLTDSSGSIFYLWGSLTDANYTETNQVLADHRLLLQNRSIQLGPPPYAHCP